MLDLVIDLDALRHNFRQLRGYCAPETRIMAVVKADAYGHGLVPVARTLVREGVDYLGVAYLEEGVQLRAVGIGTPILLLMGILPSQAAAVVGQDLEVALYHREVAQALAAQARSQGRRVRVHVKVETGMGRLGLLPEEAWELLEWLTTLPELEIMGLISHFAVADWADKAYTQQQLNQFNALVAEARGRGWALPVSHIANSAGILEMRDAHHDMVRAGIMLYGSPPAETPPPVALKPVMSFRTEVIQVKQLPPGASISYGCTYVTPGHCTIAVLPVGYCRGYSRLLSNRGEVLIRGRRAPIRGRVCMNLTMVEVSHIPGVQAGEPVTLLGNQEGQQITADELAGWAQTISYEVHCLLGNSNSKRYIGDDDV